MLDSANKEITIFLIQTF